MFKHTKLNRALLIGLALMVSIAAWGMLPGTALADAAGAEAPLSFPNAQIETAIRVWIDKPTGALCPADVAHVTELDLSRHALTDIEFLRHFTGLTALYLEENAIRDIAPLAGLTFLETLDLSHNPGLQDVSCLAGLECLTDLRVDDGVGR